MRKLFSNPLDDGWILISDPCTDSGFAEGWEWLSNIPREEVEALVAAINHAIAVYEEGDDKEE